MKKIVINIRGMDCASDAVNIEKELLKVKGVKNASVNYLVHKGFAYTDNNVIEKKLMDAVKRAGYYVVNIKFEEEKK